MDIFVADLRLTCCEEFILCASCIWMGLSLQLNILVLGDLLRLLVQELINVPSAQRDILLRLLVPFSLPKDQESKKVGLNHVIQVPPDLRL